MSAVPAVAPLDALAARRITRELQSALDLAVDLLGQAFAGRAWIALGYKTWQEYTAAELPQLAILGKGLPVEERRATVAELRGQHGMSLRAIAEPLGLSPNTVRGDLDAAGVELATVTSLDGRRRPAAAAPAPARRRVPTTDRLVTLIRAAGPDGLTVVEVMTAARLPRERVSPALTRLTAAGRLDYRAPERRGQFGRYVGGIIGR